MSTLAKKLSTQSATSPKDPYFGNVTLLLNGDGTNGQQNNTFVDSSSNNFTVTRSGNTTQGALSPYGDYWSVYVPGSGIATSVGIDVSNVDFTAEFWVYILNDYVGSDIGLFGARTGDSPVTNLRWSMYVNASGYLTANAHNSAGNVLVQFSHQTPMPRGNWVHCALVRSGTTFKLYQNGVVSSSTPTSSGTINSGGIRIGYQGGNTFTSLGGYISNARIVTGRAVYNSSFTPSAVPLGLNSGGENPPQGTETKLLTANSVIFIDQSVNNATITLGAGTTKARSSTFSPFGFSAKYNPSNYIGSTYLDGTGDGLSIASNAAFAMDSEAFTVELWWYFVSSSSTLVTIVGSGATDNWFLRWNSIDGSFSVGVGNGNTQFTTPTGSTGTSLNFSNRWHHIVFVRSGTGANQTSFFLDGVRIGNGTVNYPFSSSQAFGVANILGFVSDVRVVKGVAVYDPSQLTINVPSAPLQAIPNTSALLKFANAGIADLSRKCIVETVGNAQINTSIKKYGTGSIKFDGSGDRLFIPAFAEMSLSNVDFTIEFWMYLTSTSTNQVLFSQRTATTQTAPYISVNGNVLYIYLRSTTGFISGSFTTVNTWVHFALCKNGTSTKAFIDGTQFGSTYTDTNSYALLPITIGDRWDGTLPFNGYIDDLRITNGVARYTSDFTPPTEALPTK